MTIGTPFFKVASSTWLHHFKTIRRHFGDKSKDKFNIEPTQLGKELSPDVIVFVVVRHPLARIVSFYYNLVLRGLLVDFILSVVGRVPSGQEKRDDDPKCDHSGHQETM